MMKVLYSYGFFFLNCQNPDVSFYALLDQLLESNMVLNWVS